MSVGQYDWRYPVSFQGGRRKWNWHASQAEPDGRILMPLKYLHPEDGHVADASGHVDITALQGKQVRMRRIGVLRLLHVHWARWDFLTSFLPLDQVGDGGDAYYLFDPGTRMSEIYDAWEARLSEPKTMSEFAEARAIYRYANPPKKRMPPRAVLIGAARAMTHNPVRAGDLRQFIEVRMPQLPRLLKFIRARREDIAASRSQQRFEPVSEEQLTARVPFLAGLANSCFATEEEEAERFAGPDATSRIRLDRITVGFVPAAFFTYAKAPVMRQPAVLPRYLRSFLRFGDEAVAENPAFDIASPADIDRAFEHVAFGKLKVISGSRGWRDRMIHDAASVMRHARRTMMQFDPDGSKGIRAQAPAEQTDREDFLKRVKAEYADDRVEYGASRSEYANRVKNAYDRVIDAAAHRTLQIRSDGDAGRAAIDILCSPDGIDLPYWDVFVPGAELSETGHPTGRQQLRRYRWWRLDDAWLSAQRDRHWSAEPPRETWRATQHEAGGAPVVVRSLPTDAEKAKRPPFLGAEFVCEYLGATLADRPDVASIPPFLATLARHHAFTDPGYLDVGQRQDKEDLRQRWRIRSFGAGNRGLLQFDVERTRLARTVSRSSRSHPRVFIPHEEAEHALRLAAHGVDATVQTWCRQSEFIQQVQYGDRWEDPAGTDAFGWFASRKLKRRDPIGVEHFLECDENHYLESVALLNLSKRRCRLEENEIVDPPGRISWKLEPAPFVFAFDGAVVGFSRLRAFLGVLLVNVIEARFHDLRAGASNRSRRKGTHFEALGEGLGHRSAGFIELYSGLTPEQLEEEVDEIRVEKATRIQLQNERRNAA